jgi:hypothetical protein
VSLVVGLVGLWLAFGQPVPERLGYRLATPPRPLLPEARDLPLRLLCPAPPGGQGSRPASATSRPLVRLAGKDWTSCKSNAGLLDVEVVNLGAKPLWCDAGDAFRNVDRPVLIQLSPPSRIMGAWVIRGTGPQPDEHTKFATVPDAARFGAGQVEVRWHRLMPGRPLVVRILYIGSPEPVDVTLATSLKAGGDPVKLGPGNDPREDGRPLERFRFWAVVFVMLVLVFNWGIRIRHAIRARRMDEELEACGYVPKGLASAGCWATGSDLVMAVALIILAVVAIAS